MWSFSREKKVHKEKLAIGSSKPLYFANEKSVRGQRRREDGEEGGKKRKTTGGRRWTLVTQVGWILLNC